MVQDIYIYIACMSSKIIETASSVLFHLKARIINKMQKKMDENKVYIQQD